MEMICKIPSEKLAKLQSVLGYEFSNLSLLAQALTHKSCKDEANNERLEFLGDAVLDLVVGEYLFQKYSKKNEGSLSKIRASLVNEMSFFKIASKLGLGEFIRLSFSEEKSGGREKPSILSDALEAVMGAVYLEGGISVVRQIFIPLLEEICSGVSFQSLLSDYKTTLQEITQERMAQTPQYKLVGATGPDHQKRFEMAVVIGGKEWARAIGTSKKDAEQKAAQKAVELLKKGKE